MQQDLAYFLEITEIWSCYNRCMICLLTASQWVEKLPFKLKNTPISFKEYRGYVLKPIKFDWLNSYFYPTVKSAWPICKQIGTSRSDMLLIFIGCSWCWTCNYKSIGEAVQWYFGSSERQHSKEAKYASPKADKKTIKCNILCSWSSKPYKFESPLSSISRFFLMNFAPNLIH